MIKPFFTKQFNSLSLIDGIISDTPYREGTELDLPVSQNFTSQVLLELEKLPNFVRRGDRLVLKTSAPAFWCLYFARAILEAHLDFSSRLLSEPLHVQMEPLTISSQWSAYEFVSFAKYCCVWPFARFIRQSQYEDCGSGMPEVPSLWNSRGMPKTPFLFSGKYLKYLKNLLMNVRSLDNASFFFTLLQGVKRACYPVPDKFVYDSMLKHKNMLQLSRSRLVRLGQLGAWADDIEAEEALEKFTPLFDNLWACTHKMVVKNVTPSVSAAFNYTRSSGGAAFACWETLGLFPDDLLHIEEIRPGVTIEMRGRAADDALRHLMKYASAEPNHTMVAPVLEPLKVRLITKGPPLSQTISKIAQKTMWEHLFDMKQFRPIGEPLSVEHVKQLFHDSKSEFDCWVSGDYSSATDSIQNDVTCKSFESFLKLSHVDEELKDIFRKVLYEQEIYYPEKYQKIGPGLENFTQERGQLMGSVLSFPVLCSINFVCFWAAYNEYNGYYTPRERVPVLINGDDILFRANKRLISIWRKYIQAVGFSLSIGKNYVHERYFTMNSMLFRTSFNKDRTDILEIRDVPYLNIGLLIGNTKVQRVSSALSDSIQDVWSVVMHGSHSPKRVLKRFIHYHYRTIEELTRKGLYNLFIPRDLGGLGLEPPVGDFHVTHFQRKLGFFLRSEMLASHAAGREFHGLWKSSGKSITPGLMLPDTTFPILEHPKDTPVPENFVEYKGPDLIEMPPLSYLPVAAEATSEHIRKDVLKKFNSRDHREMSKSRVTRDPTSILIKRRSTKAKLRAPVWIPKKGIDLEEKLPFDEQLGAPSLTATEEVVPEHTCEDVLRELWPKLDQIIPGGDGAVCRFNLFTPPDPGRAQGRME